jgi:hypothetical protein
MLLFNIGLGSMTAEQIRTIMVGITTGAPFALQAGDGNTFQSVVQGEDAWYIDALSLFLSVLYFVSFLQAFCKCR